MTKKRTPPSGGTASYNEMLMYGSKGKKKNAKKPTGYAPEDKLQSAANAYMKEMYPNIVCNADIAGIGIAACTQRAIRNGRRKGMADYTIFKGNDKYHGLLVEFKAGKNVPTKEQIQVGKEVMACGYCWIVIYEIGDFIRAIKAYMAIPDSRSEKRAKPTITKKPTRNAKIEKPSRMKKEIQKKQSTRGTKSDTRVQSKLKIQKTVVRTI